MNLAEIVAMVEQKLKDEKRDETLLVLQIDYEPDLLKISCKAEINVMDAEMNKKRGIGKIQGYLQTNEKAEPDIPELLAEEVFRLITLASI